MVKRNVGMLSQQASVQEQKSWTPTRNNTAQWSGWLLLTGLLLCVASVTAAAQTTGTDKAATGTELLSALSPKVLPDLPVEPNPTRCHSSANSV